MVWLRRAKSTNGKTPSDPVWLEPRIIRPNPESLAYNVISAYSESPWIDISQIDAQNQDPRQSNEILQFGLNIYFVPHDLDLCSHEDLL